MNIPELPDTTKWQPRDTATDTLQSAFLKRCLTAEKSILLRVKAEREMNIDNFDSGPGIEDIVREEFARILPSRYSIESGVLIDREGKTGGDYDLLVFNDLWFPQIKAGATEGSRRSFYPIEGVYAVGEIKQTLNYTSLDASLKKLVMAHRLERPATYAKRIVENRESSSCSHGLSNPLYSFILATKLSDETNFEEMINRFYDVNRQLKRLEIIRCMCVLGHGTVFWGVRDGEGEISPALFMLEDLYEPLVPVYSHISVTQSALFVLLNNLSLHLFHSVLAPEDVAAWYGTLNRTVKSPRSTEITIEPDADWVDRLERPCNDDHDW